MGPSNSFYAADSTAQTLASSLSAIEALSLPAGTFVVNATVWLQDVSPSDSSDLAVCELTEGAASDEVAVGLLGPSSAPQNEATLSMTVAGSDEFAGAATVKCAGEGNTGETQANTVNITAIQSSSLTG